MVDVIQVENLSKAFRIGLKKQLPDTLIGALRQSLKAPLANFRRLQGLDTSRLQPNQEMEGVLWALRDVSFNVAEGDVIGIIGRNGSGKSTLLKVISRITGPTHGRVLLRGRVSSLLEVGTGFHHDLTGRDNVYMNGTILGMRKAEIDKKFDEIVEFSGVERFLDTPIKRYSSGMKVRLAFAVAAHLEPEVLIVDEVLAVGDIAFQKRCLGKMRQMAGSGRTVLFVSHKMQAVRSLCNRALLLSSGRLVQEGNVNEVIEKYLELNHASTCSHWQRANEAETPLQATRISSELEGTQPSHRLKLSIDFRSTEHHDPALVLVDFFDQVGDRMMQATPTMEPFIEYDTNERTMSLEIELPPLIPGHYTVGIWMGTSLNHTLFEVMNAVSFHIVDSPMKNRSRPHDASRGYIVPMSKVELLRFERKPLAT